MSNANSRSGQQHCMWEERHGGEVNVQWNMREESTFVFPPLLIRFCHLSTTLLLRCLRWSRLLRRYQSSPRALSLTPPVLVNIHHCGLIGCGSISFFYACLFYTQSTFQVLCTVNPSFYREYSWPWPLVVLITFASPVATASQNKQIVRKHNNSRYKMGMWHKTMSRGSDVHARKLVSDAVTVLPSTHCESPLLRISFLFSVQTK
jgi:hypothetical protein